MVQVQAIVPLQGPSDLKATEDSRQTFAVHQMTADEFGCVATDVVVASLHRKVCRHCAIENTSHTTQAIILIL
jgi:hypothetical protein